MAVQLWQLSADLHVTQYHVLLPENEAQKSLRSKGTALSSNDLLVTVREISLVNILDTFLRRFEV